MVQFTTTEDLQRSLQELQDGYDSYADQLWAGGVRNSSEIAHADIAHLEHLGVQRLHATNMKAKFKIKGDIHMI